MTVRTRRARSVRPPYSLTATVYDEIYRGKDYRAETGRIRRIVRENGRAAGRDLLDVACGTGGHLEYLSRWFRCTGLDSNPAMLRVARSKLPQVPFVQGRMESFRLHRTFDVLTCLFSAIGYVRSEAELRRTIHNFAAHLAPGGVAVVEPWFNVREYRAGSVHLERFGSPDRPIVRMNLSDRRGDRSILDMHHLVGTPRGVVHWVERHDLGLFTREAYLRAFRSAGLRPHFVGRGFMRNRGLYVAVRPRRTGAGAQRRTQARAIR